MGGAAVGGELIFKGGGDRTLGDHARGKNSENSVALLVPEGRLGDGYVHGSLSPKADVNFLSRRFIYGFSFDGKGLSEIHECSRRKTA
jgi:hypothetical protein